MIAVDEAVVYGGNKREVVIQVGLTPKVVRFKVIDPAPPINSFVKVVVMTEEEYEKIYGEDSLVTVKGVEFNE